MNEPSATRAAPKPPPARRRSRVGPFIGFVFFPVFSMAYICWLSRPESRVLLHDLLVSIGLAAKSQPPAPRPDPIYEIECKIQEARSLVQEARENHNDAALLDEAEQKAREAISIAERWKSHPGYRDLEGAQRRLDREIRDIRLGLLRFIQSLKPMVPPDRLRTIHAPPSAPSDPIPADAI